MYSIALFAEGAGQNGMGWAAWVALAVFFVMVLLGWWVSKNGWLKQEPEPIHEEHSHEHPVHEEEHTHTEPAPAANQPDDLTTLEGIGPKVAKLLESIGITSFQQLAEADLTKLRQTLDGAGYNYMEPAGWVEQAALAAQGDTEGLQRLQASLKGGRKAG